VLYATSHVDVVVDSALTGKPDTLPPLTPLDIDGLQRPAYRAYPLADHCADKLCAIIETHHQAGQTRESTRVKDLVDLAPVARTQHVGAKAFRAAIIAGTAHRGLPIPGVFAAPDLPSWRTGFTKTLAAAHAQQITFPEALDLVGRFLDPILAGASQGTWDPDQAAWRSLPAGQWLGQ
jgi:hypothetical protein